MRSYAVIWNTPGETPVAGSLEVGIAGLDLRGGKDGTEWRVHIAYDEILGLGRVSERVGRLGAFRLDGREIGTLLIAAIGGAAVNSEILSQLQTSLSAFV